MVLQVGEEVGGCSEFLGPWPTNTGETGGGLQVLCVGAGFEVLGKEDSYAV